VIAFIAGCLAVIAYNGITGPEKVSASEPVHVIVDRVDPFAFQFTNVPVRVER
jgi:hypothetical protein